MYINPLCAKKRQNNKIQTVKGSVYQFKLK